MRALARPLFVDAHEISDLNSDFAFISSRLFFTQHHSFHRSIENEEFNRTARQDLIMQVRRSRVEFSATGPRFSTQSTWKSRRSLQIWPFLRDNRTVSMTELDGKGSSPPRPFVHRTDEFRVDIQENVPILNSDIELTPAQGIGYVGSAIIERQTFADVLMALTMRDYRSL